MAAVSDSSPLILFARIGQLDLIRAVFDEILVPSAVWHEVVTSGARRAGAREVLRTNWIRHRPLPGGEVLKREFALDPGEAEAIALAASQEPKMAVLLDDDPARRMAHDLGLVVIGSGGILVLAKRRGLLSSIRPHLSALQSAGLFLGEAVVIRLLERAGE